MNRRPIKIVEMNGWFPIYLSKYIQILSQFLYGVIGRSQLFDRQSVDAEIQKKEEEKFTF